MNLPLLQVQHLSKQFRIGRHLMHAVRDVSFSLASGKILGLGGESGCGKSTLGKLLMRLIEPTKGSIAFEGQDLWRLNSQEIKSWRSKIQMIFQHPAASLNPCFTVEDTLSESLTIHGLAKGAERAKRLAELLSEVGLTEDYLKRLPHQLSGGQKQRVSIARALAVEPRLLICDEPFASLDVTVQVQIIHLLVRLQREKLLTYVVISHDLSVLRYLTHDLAIMYLGEIVEWGPSAEVYEKPLHPYTQALVSAVLSSDPVKERQRSRIILMGETPSLIRPTQGCPFFFTLSACPAGMQKSEAPLARNQAGPFRGLPQL